MCRLKEMRDVEELLKWPEPVVPICFRLGYSLGVDRRIKIYIPPPDSGRKQREHLFTGLQTRLGYGHLKINMMSLVNFKISIRVQHRCKVVEKFSPFCAGP